MHLILPYCNFNDILINCATVAQIQDWFAAEKSHRDIQVVHIKTDAYTLGVGKYLQ